ncbi:MAG: HIT family protein [Pseudomonadales bacterium]|nr:HIT family protein [Pseudomonadales bacterium]
MFELHAQLAADTSQIAESDLNLLLLMNDQNYPWCMLVPKRANIKEVFQLSRNDQHQLMDESSLLAQTLMDSFQAHKINVAALGNVVPQLHIHHVARFQDDAAWPKPIWGQVAAIPYDNERRDSVINTLKLSALDKYFSF